MLPMGLPIRMGSGSFLTSSTTGLHAFTSVSTHTSSLAPFLPIGSQNVMMSTVRGVRAGAELRCGCLIHWGFPTSLTGSGTQWLLSKQVSSNRRDYSTGTHQVTAGVCSLRVTVRLARLLAYRQNTGSIQLMEPFIIIVIIVLFVPGSGQGLASW